MQLQSTLTCPKCSYQAVETMPTDACQFFYDCKGCGERLKPLAGDCCVFCSYGSVVLGGPRQEGAGFLFGRRLTDAAHDVGERIGGPCSSTAGCSAIGGWKRF